MTTLQTISSRQHTDKMMHLCAKNFEKSQDVRQSPQVSDNAHQDVSKETQSLLQIGQMLETTISTTSIEHEKLKSALEKKKEIKQDPVSAKSIVIVLALTLLIFLSDILFSYF
jgi:hypothetical protein